MRKYYVCEAECPSKIYTELEKSKSVWPGCRFGLIGEFRNRCGAYDAIEKYYDGCGYALKNNDGENVYVDAVKSVD